MPEEISTAAAKQPTLSDDNGCSPAAPADASAPASFCYRAPDVDTIAQPGKFIYPDPAHCFLYVGKTPDS